MMGEKRGQWHVNSGQWIINGSGSVDPGQQG